MVNFFCQARFSDFNGSRFRMAVIIPFILLFVSFMTLIQAAAPVVGDDVTTHILDNQDLVLVLDGTDGDGDPVSARVTELPAAGKGSLYQYDGGEPDLRGSLIDAVPAFVTDPQRRVVFAPDGPVTETCKATFVWDVFAGGEYSVGTASGLVWVGPSNRPPEAGRLTGGWSLRAGINANFVSRSWVEGDVTVEFWYRDTPPYMTVEIGDSYVALTPLSCVITHGDGATTITLDYCGVQDDNEWSHLAVVRDESEKRWTIYQNGVLMDSKVYSGPVASAAGCVHIGWPPVMDELIIWRECRTQEQIAGDMRRCPQAPETNLAGWWRFNVRYIHEDMVISPCFFIDESGNHETEFTTYVYRVYEEDAPPQLIDLAPRLQARDDRDTTVTLQGGDPEREALTAFITELPPPGEGELYQFAGEGPVRGPRIESVPATVTDPEGRVVFVPAPGASPYTTAVKWKVNDGVLDSPNEAQMDLLVGYGLHAIVVDPNAPGPRHDGRTWEEAYTTIQGAIGDPESAYRPIFVAGGTYRDPIQPGDHRQVYGGFEGYGGAEETAIDQRDWTANKTTIDVSIYPYPYSAVCLYLYDEENGPLVDARVDGFTLTGATAWPGYPGYTSAVSARTCRRCVIANCEFTGNKGYAGVSLSATLNSRLFDNLVGAPDSSLDVINCEFHDEDGYSVYMYCLDDCEGARFQDCDFHHLDYGVGQFFGTNSLKNCRFHDMTYTDDGGENTPIFFAHGKWVSYATSRVRFEDCEFENNYCPHEVDKGLLSVLNDVDFVRCSFTNNEGQMSSPIIYIFGDGSVFTDCEFVGNICEYYGVLYSWCGQIVMNGCVFRNNYSEQRGAAICCNNGGFTANDCLFEYNTSGASGGAIYGIIGANNCVFQHNEAADKGGAVYNSATGSIFNGCTLRKNRAGVAGGAFAMYGHGIETGIRFDNCDIAWNEAPEGGGVFVTGPQSEISLVNGTVVRCNRATNGMGGGLKIDQTRYFIVRDSTLLDNYAVNSPGGGAYVYQCGDLSLERATIDGNHSEAGGGGLMVEDCDIAATDTLFIRNCTTDKVEYDPAWHSPTWSYFPAGGGGGGLCVYGPGKYAVVNEGAEPAVAQLWNCRFLANHVYDSPSSGAPGSASLEFMRQVRLEMWGGEIRDNTIEGRGVGDFTGICNDATDPSTMDGVYVYRNTNGTWMVYDWGEYKEMMTGGGVNYAILHARNCVFAKTWPGVALVGGVGGWTTELSTAKNCTFVNGNTGIPHDNCIVAGTWVGGFPTSFGQPPNRRTLYEEHPVPCNLWGWEGQEPLYYYDPLFADRDAGDFRILAGSPAVDAGFDTGLTEDFDGLPRPVDIPGVGTTDIYDIGAYELHTGKAASVWPTYVEFGETTLAPGESLTASVCVANIGTETVSLLDASFSGDAAFSFASPPDLSDLDAGTTRGLEIAFSRDATGSFEGTLTILSDATSPTMTVDFTGSVVDRWIEADPPSVEFLGARVLPGESTDPEALALRNSGTTPLYFTNVNTDMGLEIIGPDASCFAVTMDDRTEPVPGGGSRNLEITFTPDGEGLKTATLRVHSDDLETPVLDVPLSGVINRSPVAEVATLGGSAAFEYEDSAITFGTPAEMSLRDDFTVEAWARPSRVLCSEGRLIIGDVQISPDSAGYLLNLQPDGKPVFSVVYSVMEGLSAMGDDPVTTNTLIHFAGTFDGKTVKLYVNGTLAASSSLAAPLPLPDYAGEFLIGGLPLGTAPFFGGLDDVRVWNYVRSQSQILNYRYQELTGDEPGLIGYWKLNDGTGLTARDASPTGLHGVLDPSVEWRVTTDTLSSRFSELIMPARMDAETTITLGGTDADGNPLAVYVTELPGAGEGELYQLDGPGPVRGAIIDSVPALVTDPDGRLVFAPDASPTSYTTRLRWKVSDGFLDSDNPTLYEISVYPNNVAPTLISNQGVECDTGETASIGSDRLRVYDPDNPANQITFTVTVFPVYGTLRIGTTTLEPGELNTFTQADIDAGFLSYVHGGAASTEDDFEFTCTDQEAVIGPGIFTITIHTQSKVWDWKIIR